ncbi:MAG: large conductance mechanosensitive channel protein MscL [Lachnospiraceae bacterium]|nr:large conductance mechanosensitive channel protein MscL [Lachnospiraceae bacterium]
MAKKGNGVVKEFKEFISRGNVLDMAVGIIIGSAFTAIVTSLVSDLINPLIGTIFGGFNLSTLNVTVKLPWVKWMMERGMDVSYPVLAFGSFIKAIIAFLVTAIALFALIKGINALKGIGKKKTEEAPAAPTTKICPYCKSEVNIEATRCPHCTSSID